MPATRIGRQGVQKSLIQFWGPSDEWEELQRLAAIEDVSGAHMLRRLMREYLAEREALERAA